ncbi:hypothetical protein Pst134EA_013852 [Puccinia striiformis f. sp. tritici]|uniref:hypothetical protein n=1 Tax=Puccinia striiformis f. sp. tritici TaxID=168172 RepID=UPI002008BBA9|nr:hypothetical protein Pst134EA_013852 [Puccinia striiformis f. sp. tritici]KAH9465997.1 hypothetical protein Pst134EA_013852 [Puccinia striiformis f. sp. tritici]
MMTQESPSIPGVGRKQAKYVLGRSSTESKRLSDQHEVLLKAAGGYIPVPLSIESEMLEAILDVGTGNGAWLVGLRQSGILPTSVELCGVDVSDKMMPSKELGRKFGLDLRVRDLSDPLPSTWNGKFDYIHGRHVFIWIEPYKWLNVMCNLKRTLKPGGTLVVGSFLLIAVIFSMEAHTCRLKCRPSDHIPGGSAIRPSNREAAGY